MNYSDEKMVAVIILNWNGYSDTCECIDSVLLNTYKHYRIIVVDNNSDNREAEKIANRYQSNKKVSVIANEDNLGYCGGNNTGVKCAIENGCPLALILNNDTTIKKDLIDQLIKKLRKDSLGIVGASINDYKCPDSIQNQGIRYNPWFSTALAENWGKKYSQTKTTKANCVSGACFLVDLGLIEGNLFDEEFFCYFEEVDLCQRLRLRGVRIGLATEAVVYHKGSVSADSIKGFSEFQMAKNRFLVIKKNSNLIQRVVFLFFFFFFYWYFHLLVLNFSKRRENVSYFLKGSAKGFAYFFNI